MLKVNMRLPLDYDGKIIKKRICSSLGIEKDKLQSYKLLKLSPDARDKSAVCFNASFAVAVDKKVYKKAAAKKGVQEYSQHGYTSPKPLACAPKLRPVVVGAGPAGLFCAYVLALSGARPIVCERGETIEKRVLSVERFWKNGELDTESNVQFGEGGAGTFSDGKLNTGIRDERISFVFDTLVGCGAPEEILWRQKPHVGTDKLRFVITNLRKKIIELGGEFMFGAKLCGIKTSGGSLKAAVIERNGAFETVECGRLVLALGHSARDTFEMLLQSGVEMTQKPFAVGVRIEHGQQFINKAQYGAFADHPALPTADYKLAVHLQSGRGLYTFCMCPGGFVVNASSEKNMIAVNGMSNFDRAGKNANSALLCGVGTDDLQSSHPLAGVEFQRKIESAAYSISGSYRPPAMTVGALFGKRTPIAKVEPTANVAECDISKVLPDFVSDSLKDGLLLMDKKIKGFCDDNAVLTAPETRSSSPVRITRDDCGRSNVFGIYPCGEGAGYAGGIVSAAVDGIKTAENVIASLR